MLLIIGTIRLPADRVAAARPAMARMIAASRAEEGCIDYAYAEDVCAPGLVRVMELWRDQAALDRHFGSAHLREWRATWAGLGITDRDLRVYDIGEPRPT
jgi:quinol monooxygenase YgiN